MHWFEMTVFSISMIRNVLLAHFQLKTFSRNKICGFAQLTLSLRPSESAEELLNIQVRLWLPQKP